MLDINTPSSQRINIDDYRDRILGCWTGKNIGGTLGVPFEGKQEMNDVSFYTQELDGNPAPNDDLDLQLIWLLALEDNGVYHLNERILAEYWINFIIGPWNEYGVCKANIRNGLYPPLSGSCNNDTWKYSNGAWIRSEIWACLFPGSPDEAVRFAYYDACCDHCGEGIYAEIFTAAAESVAFIVNDIREVIRIGLAYIPDDCRIARSVKLACDSYDNNVDFVAARNAMVEDSADLGWFQAPANIGFMVLGLLYGEGDFGKSICLAVNCGDDTDCTAGTAAALLGIMQGRSGIPAEWIKPIGENIKTMAVAPYHLVLPRTLDELTRRVMRMAQIARTGNATLPLFTTETTEFTADYRQRLGWRDAVEINKGWESPFEMWKRSPFELTFDLPFGQFLVDYDNGPEVMPGESKKITIGMGRVKCIEKVVSVRLLLPEGWRAEPDSGCIFTVKGINISHTELQVIPGEFNGPYCYIPAEIRFGDRLHPVTVNLPFQKRGAVNHNPVAAEQGFMDAFNRKQSCLRSIASKVVCVNGAAC